MTCSTGQIISTFQTRLAGDSSSQQVRRAVARWHLPRPRPGARRAATLYNKICLRKHVYVTISFSRSLKSAPRAAQRPSSEVRATENARRRVFFLEVGTEVGSCRSRRSANRTRDDDAVCGRGPPVMAQRQGA